MSTIRQYITDWSLNLYPVPVESMEVRNDPGFEESGSFAFRLRQQRQFAELSMDEDTLVIQEIHNTFSSEFLAIKLSLLCSGVEVADYSIESVLHSLEVLPHLIDRFKTQIVSEAVRMAIYTRNRGLKKFGIMVDIYVTTLTQVESEIEEVDLMMEEHLRWVLLQSMTMAEMNLKKNPASKSSIEKLKRGYFEVGVGVKLMKKNCTVCLDDFQADSKVIWMPCSHMFHEGCLESWLKESNSCPLCRLKLTD